MNDITDSTAPPPDFDEDDRWKAYACGIDELDIPAALKRLNLSYPYKFGVTNGMRYIEFHECLMVSVDKDDVEAITKSRIERLQSENAD